MQFDHVGIATRDIAGLADLFENLLEAPIAHEERLGDLQIVFLELDGGGYFELLEPRGEGPIATYLDEHGPGIHHVALATDDVTDALDRARSMDIDCIDDEPRQGAWGHRIAFLHPRSTGGVLVEFVEHASGF